MSHPAQIKYCSTIKSKLPTYFENVSVLDVGSLDINGNNRYLFKNSTYTGIDIGEGKNVDYVCDGHKFRSKDQYDVVISTECFEHNKYWDITIYNMWMLLKPKGLMLFTCASDGRQEHGTTRTDTWSSPFTNDYYMNLNELILRERINLDAMFSEYQVLTNNSSYDLYFYGIKKPI